MIDIGKQRKQAGLSIEDIASQMKVSASTVRNWEIGKIKPSLASEIMLTKILGISDKKRK